MSRSDFAEENRALSNRVKEIRINMGKTQEEFAELFGVTLNAYKKFESAENQITLKALRILNKEYNISSDYLLFGEKTGMEDVWKGFQNCEEEDKLLLLLRIWAYFSKLRDEKYISNAVLDKLNLYFPSDND